GYEYPRIVAACPDCVRICLPVVSPVMAIPAFSEKSRPSPDLAAMSGMSACVRTVRMSGSDRLLGPLVNRLGAGPVPGQKAVSFEVRKIPPSLPIRDPVTESLDVLRHPDLLTLLE